MQSEDSVNIDSVLDRIVPVDANEVLASISPTLVDSSITNLENVYKRNRISCEGLFEEKKRKGWNGDSTQARCDFSHHWDITPRGGVLFISIWKKTLYGRLFTEIKEDPDMVSFFSRNMVEAICKVLGHTIKGGDWALITAPRRRHVERNFATLVSISIADALGIPFYEDALACKNRQRINAEFTMQKVPREHNIIVFDDIVTTGSTLGAIDRALSPYGKVLVYFTAINNKI